ncbi:MarR family transcriptional regulator [Salmonella enterica]|nr:MarR family transcriptional regulator [Salmonella enterica]EEH5466130.1 MarR family transcriptional regulator [Salmonella enterica]EEH7555574.1 MarR family transcriptional regulator [Salmonella enterica]EEO5639937.1 MarR family transcriptional regulator [Salmonella enterica]EEQ0203906.1 MarR family transcriptional regulator [Salmonella enterica]
MAFSWTEERIHYLHEHAGMLTSREIAEALGTNVTAVRNMAARLKLSLRVRGYTPEQADLVHELYATRGDISVREISAKTGLSYGAVSYILYAVSRKTKPLYNRLRFVEFETEESTRFCVETELIDASRTCLESLTSEPGGQDIWLLDGSHFMARNIYFTERITSAGSRLRGR